MLPPQTRRFFAHLSVFRGGWTTEAAQVVCDEPFAADYLTQLRAHSLLVTQQAGVPRFVLLDSLREFAAEQLSENEKAKLTARHGAFFGRMAKESENALKGDNQQEWLRKMDADYENLHKALLRGGESGLVMVGSLRRYWLIHGPLRPSVEIAETLMNENPDAARGSDEARAVALATMGALYLRLGDYELSQARIGRGFALVPGAKQRSAGGKHVKQSGDFAAAIGRPARRSRRAKRKFGDSASHWRQMGRGNQFPQFGGSHL